MDDSMNPQEKFYVYTYSYPDGTPFYVGKGCGRRLRVHICNARAGRNKISYNVRVINKLLREGKEPIIKKITDCVDEEFSILVEQEYIAKHGRRDINTGILTNGTDGGDGAIGVTPNIMARRVAGLLRGGVYTRFKTGRTPANKGKKSLPEVVEKIRASHLGKKQSAKSKIKRGLKLRGYVHQVIVCPHCGTLGGRTTMKRWHFDACTGAKKFRARITVDGKRVHIGQFATYEQAQMAEAKSRRMICHLSR